MEKKRIYYLDIAKGLGVVLVILGHIVDLTIPTRQFITSFHMPLFFLISGMIIHVTEETNRDMRSIVKRKLRSIAVPYFSFSVLSLLVEAAAIAFLKNGLWSIFLEHLFATVCLVGASVFWFLPALFFGELLFIAVRKRTGKAVCGALMVLLAAAAYLACTGAGRVLADYSGEAWYLYVQLLMNSFFRLFVAAGFVAAGYFSRELFQNISAKPIQSAVSGVLLLVLTAFVSVRNGITDMNYMVYNNVLLYLITSLGGSFGILFLSRALEKWQTTLPMRICMYYGRNSLIVMMTHAPFYIMYVAARVAYGINNHVLALGQIPLCAVMLLGVLVMEAAVIKIINRYFPFLVGRSRV